jgi:hypothetical protein
MCIKRLDRVTYTYPALCLSFKPIWHQPVSLTWSTSHRLVKSMCSQLPGMTGKHRCASKLSKGIAAAKQDGCSKAGHDMLATRQKSRAHVYKGFQIDASSTKHSATIYTGKHQATIPPHSKPYPFFSTPFWRQRPLVRLAVLHRGAKPAPQDREQVKP